MPLKKATSPRADQHRRGARDNDQLRQAIDPRHSIPAISLQHLCSRLHALGPRPMYELLREIVAGASLFDRPQRCAALDPGIVRSLGDGWCAVSQKTIPSSWRSAADQFQAASKEEK